jgi:tetratricopeptide (TPR) repeat protein
MKAGTAMELFHLTIGRKKTRGAYSVDLRSAAGDATGVFKPPYRGKKFKGLLQRVAGGKPSQDELHDIGVKLFGRLFEGDVYDKYQQSLALAKRNGPLRIVLSLAADELHRYPWEMMYDGTDFLAASGHMQLLRRIGLSSPPSSVVAPPLRVLVAVSDPIDVLPDLDIQREVAWIASAVGSGDICVEIQPATRHILQRRLREEVFDVFHFIGHGTFSGAEGYLCFEKDNCCVGLLPADALKALLEARSVPLVVLSACQSAIAPVQDVFSGVAQSLVEAGIPAVVAMGSNISDVGGSSLAREFYDTLRLKYDVAAAITEARRALYADRLDWHAPILYALHVETPALRRGTGTREELSKTAFSLDLSLCPSVPFELEFPSAIQFTKRWEQEKLADALVASTPHIVTVDGPPGSGKTALAAEMARRLAWAFPGGVLGISCQATNTLEVILTRINEQLLSPWEAHVDLAQPWGKNAVLTALKERAYLLILDNFETVLEGNREERDRILEFLSRVPSRSKALLTSRRRLDLGQRVRVVTLGKERFSMLLARIGKRRAIPPFDDDLWLRTELVAANPSKADKLLTDAERGLLEQAHAKLGGLPEAAEVFMGLVAAGEDVAALLADLAPLYRKMTPLLDMSYDRLSEGAQELLLLMSILHKPVKRGAIEAVATRTDWEASLEELIHASLVTSNRYSLHPLTREYAASKFREQTELRAAQTRAGEYFLGEDDQDALAAVDYFYEAEEWQPVVELANALVEPLLTMGLWSEAQDKLGKAVQAARTVGDRKSEGASLGNLGIFCHSLGQVEEAIEYHAQALVISREIGDRRGEGNHLGNLGLAYAALGQVEEAIGYYEQALEIAREIGDRRGEGNHLGNLGLAYADLGQVEEAIGYYEQALEIAREIGDRRGEGSNLNNLGEACKAKEEYERALACYLLAVEVGRQIKDLRVAGREANIVALKEELGEEEFEELLLNVDPRKEEIVQETLTSR